MDISSRKSLLLNLHKESSNLERATVRRTIEETQSLLSVEERKKKLEALRDAFQSTGPVVYTEEQKKRLASYKDLIDNWDTYGEYIYKPLQDLGDWVAEKTIVPIVQGAQKLSDGAQAEGVDTSKADKESAKKALEKAGATIHDFKSFKVTYSALANNDFNKIASSKVIREDVSSAFSRELDKASNLIQVDFDLEDHPDLDLNTYNQFYELAIAHHILSQEGLVKEAQIIDDFVIKNAIWDSIKGAASSAWDATKSVVSTGIKYLGKAAKWVGKLAGAAGKLLLRGIRFIVSKLPFLGVLFSVPFAIKNIIEAYNNGKRIIYDLNLSKYGFSKAKCITPLGLEHVRSTFLKSIEEHREDPEALKELLVIQRTIGAFWIDVLYAITNTFMAILDIIAIVGLFFPGPGWLVSIGALGGSFLLALGIGSLEISSEYFKDKYWTVDQDKLREVVRQEVRNIIQNGKPAEGDDSDWEWSDQPKAPESEWSDQPNTTEPKPAQTGSTDIIETSETLPIAA